MVKKIIVSMLLMIVYISFASGCVDKPEAEDSNLFAEKIAAKMQEKESCIEDFSYTLYITTHLEGEKAQKSEFDVVYKKPNKKKTVSKRAEKGSVMIYDGNFEWQYDPEAKVVKKIIIPEEYQELKIDYFKLFNDILNEYDVSVLGNDTIDGRMAYLLEAKPKESEGKSDLIDEVKIWVDNETWTPLKYEISQGTQRTEIEIQNLKINSGIQDSEFIFNVPEGAEVVTMKFEDLFNKNMSEVRINGSAEGEKETAMDFVI